ncbi:hypothetical protein [Thermobifida halotolerans]|uniref:hypothetical protein n=1 Tax=Thermobifida halotolerans TaxID=483545 RepID=UPI0011C39244
MPTAKAMVRWLESVLVSLASAARPSCTIRWAVVPVRASRSTSARRSSPRVSPRRSSACTVGWNRA